MPVTSMSAGRATPSDSLLMARVIAAVSARDIDGSLSFYAPDARFVEAFGTLEGRPAIRKFFEDWWAPYDEFSEDAAEIDDLGGGVVFVVFLQHGRLAGANNWVHYRFAAVTRWREGQIHEQVNYNEVDKARAAAARIANGMS